MSSYTLALVQMAPGESKEASIIKASDFVAQAARQGARMVCLPELFATPYFCQNLEHAHFDLAEELAGPTVTAMAAAAVKARVTVVVPLFERRGPGVYHNTQVVLGPDGDPLGVYRKMHIPDDPGFTEKFYFTPGDLGFTPFKTPVGMVGGLICWDQWFPEAARLMTLAGAQLLLYPTAIGWLPEEKSEFGAEQRDGWITIQRSHAIANGVFVGAVNRVGEESVEDKLTGRRTIEFWGSSFISGPFGQVLAMGSTDREELVMAEIDHAAAEATRRIWPFLRDRRIDAYGGLLSRYLA